MMVEGREQWQRGESAITRERKREIVDGRK
jgi:hypothetical protein